MDIDKRSILSRLIGLILAGFVFVIKLRQAIEDFKLYFGNYLNAPDIFTLCKDAFIVIFLVAAIAGFLLCKSLFMKISLWFFTLSGILSMISAIQNYSTLIKSIDVSKYRSEANIQLVSIVLLGIMMLILILYLLTQIRSARAIQGIVLIGMINNVMLFYTSYIMGNRLPSLSYFLSTSYISVLTLSYLLPIVLILLISKLQSSPQRA